jgi:hypothetical protein
VLPGLSIYKALLEQNDDRQKVLAEVEILLPWRSPSSA